MQFGCWVLLFSLFFILFGNYSINLFGWYFLWLLSITRSYAAKCIWRTNDVDCLNIEREREREKVGSAQYLSARLWTETNVNIYSSVPLLVLVCFRILTDFVHSMINHITVNCMKQIKTNDEKIPIGSRPSESRCLCLCCCCRRRRRQTYRFRIIVQSNHIK